MLSFLVFGMSDIVGAVCISHASQQMNITIANDTPIIATNISSTFYCVDFYYMELVTIAQIFIAVYELAPFLWCSKAV